MQIDRTIIKILSKTPQYSSLLVDLNKAVVDGLMDSDGSNYKFVHDKVREAAYDMIGSDEKSKFHFDIGMLLLPNCEDHPEKSVLIYALDQVNHGVPALLRDESQRLSIANLNHKAAVQMMQSYNYTFAYLLAKRSISLLPDDSWSTNYDTSLKFYELLSRAAYSNGMIDHAKVSTKQL
jgi:predicted ATPase